MATVHVCAWHYYYGEDGNGGGGHDWNLEQGPIQESYDYNEKVLRPATEEDGGTLINRMFTVDVPWDIPLPLTDELRQKTTDFIDGWIVDNTTDL